MTMMWGKAYTVIVVFSAALFTFSVLTILGISNFQETEWFVSIFPQAGTANHQLFFGIAQLVLFVWMYALVVKIFQAAEIPFLRTYLVQSKTYFNWGSLPFLHFGVTNEKRKPPHDFKLVLLLASILSLILCWTMLPFIVNSFVDLYDTHSFWSYVPYMVCLLLIILFGVIPLPPFWSSRLSFTAVFLQVLVTAVFPPLWGVSFVHVLVADILTSSSLLIWELVQGVCVTSRKLALLPSTAFCSGEEFHFGIYAQPIAFGLPFWIRFVQCVYCIFTTYHHGRKWSHIKHYLNALKYLSGLTVVVVAYLRRVSDDDSNTLLYLWIASLVVKTSFCYLWDVYADWNLGRIHIENVSKSDNYPILLRNRRMYSRNWVYYAALVSNFFMRWSWSVALSNLALPPAWSFVMALVEVLRRMQWMIFRVENEHLHNQKQIRLGLKNETVDPYYVALHSDQDYPSAIEPKPINVDAGSIWFPDFQYPSDAPDTIL